MKALVSIDLSNPMALPLMGYLESLPFASVEKRNGKTFKQACKEAKTITLTQFGDEWHRLIDEYFDNLEDAKS